MKKNCVSASTNLTTNRLNYKTFYHGYCVKGQQLLNLALSDACWTSFEDDVSREAEAYPLSHYLYFALIFKIDFVF